MNFYDLIFKGEVGHSTRMGWWENILGEFIGGVAKLIAKILKIKGNTLVWNQLVENGNFADVSVWQTYNCSYTVSNNVATVTRTNGGYFIYGSVTPIASHKYLFSCDVKPVTTKAIFDWDAGYINKEFTVVGNQWNHLDTMFAVTTVHGINTSVRVPDSADDYQLKNFMLIDLTQMFGSTKADEIYAMEQSESGSGVAYFRSLYPLPYYQYNVGSLLSFNGAGVKTTSANLMPKLTEGTYTLNGITATVDADGYIKITGSPYTSGTTLTIPFDEPFTLNKDLYCHCFNNVANASITPTFGSWYFSLTPVNRILVTNPNYDGTTVTNLRMYVGANTNPNVTLRPMFTYSSEVMDYVEHEESTSTLPISDYFPTGMKSAGSVYDELTPSKAITRIGEEDLGTLSWNRSDNSGAWDYYFFVATLDDAKTGYERTFAEYPLFVGLINNCPDKSMIFINNRGVYIRDDSYTSASDFKTAMNGVMLYYELATPVEVDITPPLNLSYQVWEGGTEQLLPVNTDTPVTTPILADIEYPDGERDDQYFTYRQYLPNNQLLGMALNTLMGKNVPFNQEALDILMKGE